MLIYKLKEKVETPGEMGVWARIAKGGRLDCVLNIDENYYIQDILVVPCFSIFTLKMED